MRKEVTHPAYGKVGFHRVSGYPGNLFGSNVHCSEFIELEIMHGAEVNDGSYHSYSDTGDSIIRVALSPAQFAELLTTMNVGTGVPCTIKRLNGQEVESIPDDIHVHELDRQREHFKDVMKERLHKLQDAQNRIKEILDQKSLNKADKKELLDVLYRSIQDAQSNIDFYLREFGEATENIVQEAKSELDAVISGGVVRAGIKALGLDEMQGHLLENK